MSPRSKVKETELSLLAYMLRNPGIMFEYTDTLKKEYFSWPTAKTIFSTFAWCYDKYGRLPRHSEMVGLLRKKKDLSPLHVASAVNDLDRVFNGVQSKIVSDQLKFFIIEKQKLQILDELSEMEPEDFKEKSITVVERIEKLQMLSQEDVSLGVNALDPSTINSFANIVEELYQGEPIPTHLPALNENTRHGGNRPGELGVFAAPTGKGKTLFLLNLGGHFTRMGKRVVYIPLENLEAEILERYGFWLTGIESSSVVDALQFQRVYRQMSRRCNGGEFWIKSWSANSINVLDISRYLYSLSKMLRVKDLRRGVPHDEAGRIDLVLVDYGDLVNPLRFYKELRHNIGSVFTQLAGLAQKFKTRVWTATQANRESLSSEVIGQQHLAEAFNKAWPARYVLTMCQTEQEQQEGRWRCGVTKNTRGKTGYLIPMGIDHARQTIWQIPDAALIPILGWKKNRASNPKTETEEINIG